jgi:hypothetical protein
MRYLILASVNAKGEWLAAGRITQKIAAILFVGRSVFADAILRQKKENHEMETYKCVFGYDIIPSPC